MQFLIDFVAEVLECVYTRVLIIPLLDVVVLGIIPGRPYNDDLF